VSTNVPNKYPYIASTVSWDGDYTAGFACWNPFEERASTIEDN